MGYMCRHSGNFDEVVIIRNPAVHAAAKFEEERRVIANRYQCEAIPFQSKFNRDEGDRI